VNVPDYISFNVPGILTRYANPTNAWERKVLALTDTQLRLLKKHKLIRECAPALNAPLNEVVIRFSDYTAEGQDFVRSGAIDKWMASCDKKGSLDAYADPGPLEKRILKFLTSRNR
jgi:hypothetical protein